MTRRDEVIGMAQEAGLIELHIEGWAPVFQGGADDIERFAALVAAAERERCAAECEEYMSSVSMMANSKDCGIHNRAVNNCAAAIRALKDGEE